MLTMTIRNKHTEELIMQLTVCQYIYNAVRNEIRFRINPLGNTVCLKCTDVTCINSDIQVYLEDAELEELENKLWK